MCSYYIIFLMSICQYIFIRLYEFNSNLIVPDTLYSNYYTLHDSNVEVQY